MGRRHALTGALACVVPLTLSSESAVQVTRRLMELEYAWL